MKIKQFENHLIYSSETIRKSIVRLGKLKKQFCVVVDKKKKFKGTLTDGDIRRGLLNNFNIKDKIENIYKKNSIYIDQNHPELKTRSILEKKKIEFVPILNRLKKVTGIFHLSYEDKKPEIENFMIIMAGGIGKRLRPFTYKVPKPLLPVNGKPIIEQIILVAKRQGIKNFLISINYLGKKIKSYLRNGEDLNVNIKYIEENKPMGTAGSLYYLKKLNKPYIVSNADIISNINYREMLEYHKKFNSFITVGAISNFEKNHYGSIIFENNLVKKIEEKKEKKTFINSGIYIINPKVRDFLTKKKFIHMTDLIETIISKKRKVHIFPIHENWYDYGIKEKYLKQKNDKF
jgi:dTDP-glucose pyrophosphorylase